MRHIFRNTPGHIPDTPSNRNLLVSVSNNRANFLGTDRHGNSWYGQLQPDGTQVWVRSRNGVINNGGINTNPIPFNPVTGLNAIHPPGRR